MANKDLFAGMKSYDSPYKPIAMNADSDDSDEDNDKGPKVGSLFDMSAPITNQGS